MDVGSVVLGQGPGTGLPLSAFSRARVTGRGGSGKKCGK